MSTHRVKTASMVAIAAGGLVVGLAVPAAGREANLLINGASIAKHSIAGNRLKANTLTGKQIKESSLGTVPRAKSLTKLVWHPITLENGWVSGSGGPPPNYRSPAYAIDAQGLVHFRGTLEGGVAGTYAFVLPKAAAPRAGLVIDTPMMASGGNAGFLLISSDGVAPSQGQATAADVEDLSVLEGITFDAH
jgi:hypothetical protein